MINWRFKFWNSNKDEICSIIWDTVYGNFRGKDFK